VKYGKLSLKIWGCGEVRESETDCRWNLPKCGGKKAGRVREFRIDSKRNMRWNGSRKNREQRKGSKK
jgi:hypothetical protein